MTNTTTDIETIALDAELSATEREISELAAARQLGDFDGAQRLLNQAITTRVSRLQRKIADVADLSGQVERLTHTLDREREVSAEWKRNSRKWEDRAKGKTPNDDATDWRSLYNDLLTKISNKLDKKDN